MVPRKELSARDDAEKEAVAKIYWTKQILSSLVGVVCGLLQLTGSKTVIGFGIVMNGLLFGALSLLGVRTDVLKEGPTQILKEGFMPAFASFLVFWILSYNVADEYFITSK